MVNTTNEQINEVEVDEEVGPAKGTLMKGKRGIIMGVANNKSLAWGITQALHAQGAELAFTFQGDALKKRVVPLAESIGSDIVLPCDVTNTASIDEVFAEIEKTALSSRSGPIGCCISRARMSGGRSYSPI